MTDATLNIPHILLEHSKWLHNDGGSRANLSDANLAGANLSGADLSGADMSDANLSGADLSGADMSDANLARANLSDANLAGANLARANLSDANLAGANLSDANLAGANMIDGGQRSDGYRFVGHVRNGVLTILAGCRYLPIEKAREHWIESRGDTPLGDETMCILDHIEAVAKIRGLIVAMTGEVKCSAP
jgi:hypothetical protein